ncbi:flagellar M-ring protein FliF [Kaarinaea lacus]
MSEQFQQNSVESKRRYFATTSHKPGLIVLWLGGFYLIGFVILWLMTKSDYTELYTGIDANKAAIVTTELQNANISYHFDSPSGTLMVRSEQFFLAQNILVEKGLLQGNDTQPRLTTNSELPYQPLEAELAKSIASIDNVQSARVHLALSSSAGNDPKDVSQASVMVRLYPGRRLSETQISSISHLVAASTPNLSLDRITIIDQSGQLLRSSGKSNVNSLTSSQFGFLRSLEQSYINRIEDILVPVLGLNAVRTQVIADVDFKMPDSESLENMQSISSKVENGNLRRLTATVIVDNRFIGGEEGKAQWVPRSTEEMQRITDLVKHAIGFKNQRGDTVTVINEPFNRMTNHHASISIPVWEQIWHENSIWYLVIGSVSLVIIVLVFLSLTAGTRVSQVFPVSSAEAITSEGQAVKEHQTSQVNSNTTVDTGSSREESFEQKLLKARQLVREDPKTVVQLVKSWMKEK